MRNILAVTTALIVMTIAAVAIRTDLNHAVNLKMEQDAEVYRTQVADLSSAQVFYEKERTGHRDERVVYLDPTSPHATQLVYRWYYNEDRKVWDDVFVESGDAPQSRTRLEIVPEDVKFYWVRGRLQAIQREPELFHSSE